MTAKPACFADVILPITPDRFFAEFWERTPLHIRRSDPAFYRGLPSPEEIDALISSGSLRYPAIQLAKSGSFLAPEAFTRTVKYGEDAFSGLLDVDKLYSEYRAGATISLPAFHRSSKIVGALTASIEGEFDHAVHGNVYITPGNADGFTPHYDTHETFILQLGGRKHWRVYEPPMSLPHRNQPFTPQRYSLPSAPLLDDEIETADLLYLPRGYVHTTTTSESFSAHVTIGITVYTWIELAAELLQPAFKIPELRRALPPGFASRADLRTSLKSGLSEMLDVLKRKADLDTVLDVLSARITAARFKTGGAFRSNVALIGAQTLMRVAAKQLRVSADRRHALVESAGRSFVLPLQALPALNEITLKKTFCAADLPGLNPDARLALVRYLQSEGVLRVASSSMPENAS